MCWFVFFLSFFLSFSPLFLHFCKSLQSDFDQTQRVLISSQWMNFQRISEKLKIILSCSDWKMSQKKGFFSFIFFLSLSLSFSLLFLHCYNIIPIVLNVFCTQVEKWIFCLFVSLSFCLSKSQKKILKYKHKHII